jgi:hypothetical protein
MDPITVSVAAKYVAKVGGPKLAAAVAEKVRQRGWARRAAKRAFGGVQQPHPVGATAKWLKAPGTLGRLYDAVLTENGPRWATKIASDRNLQAHRETQARSDLLLGNDARGNESEVKGRIAQLPKLNREAALTRWRDAKEDTWRVISLVTSVETSPPEVVMQWQAACPDWLTKAEVSARLVAADLAWAYGAPRLAANLYGSAARDGAPLAHRWAGRAAFVLLFDEDPGAARALTLESLRLGDDPMSRAVDLVIMEEDETISGQERREIDGALIRGRVGDLPLIARPELLMELAEEDRWLPGSIAVAMGRPGAWADFTRTMATLQPLVQAIIANQPQSLPAWIYRFTRGVAYRHHDQPEVARQVALLP